MITIISAILLVAAGSIIVMVVVAMVKGTIHEVRENKVVKGTDWIEVVIGIAVGISVIYLANFA